MATASTIIKKAMQRAGILVKSETPDSDEASEALDTLNNMLSSWSNDSIVIYGRVTESFPLSSGVDSYTIGAGQTFDTIRPILIVEAHTRQSNIDYALSIVSDELYQSISYKQTQSIPQYLNYTNQFPTAIINLYPIPPAGYTLFMTSEKELPQFTLSQTVSLPPGWERALINNLAVELSPEYGQKVSPELMKLANDSRGAIARSVLKNRAMDANPYGIIGQLNINRGYW